MRQTFLQLVVLQVINETSSGEEVVITTVSANPWQNEVAHKQLEENYLPTRACTLEEACYFLNLGLQQK